MKSMSLITFLLSAILFTISPSKILLAFGVFGMVVAISVFIDATIQEKKSKKHY